MAKNVEIIIDGIRHKLVKPEEGAYCGGCSLKKECRGTDGNLCAGFVGNFNYMFEKAEE